MSLFRTAAMVALSSLLSLACSSETTPVSVADGGIDAAPSDAGGDAARLDAAADAPAASFCAGAGAHFFCDDFDVFADPTATWTSSSAVGGALLALDTSAKVSPPASARASLPANAAGSSASVATLRKDVPAGHVVVDAKVRIEDTPLPAAASAQYLSVETASTRFSLVRGDQMYFSMVNLKSVPIGVPTKVAMALGAFAHVVLDVDFTQTNPTFSLTIDGVKTTGATGFNPGSSSACVVTAGIACTSASACDVAGASYDDFVIDTK